MATFCGHHSLGFGDPYGDGLRVLAAAGAVSFIDLAVLARINKGWQRQVNDWRATVQIVSLREIEFERFGVPRDAGEEAFIAAYNEFITEGVRLPERWCFAGEINKTADRRRWMADNADSAVRVILRFYRGLKTLDMSGICVSSDLLLRLPVVCPQLTLLDARGSPAGEQYELYFTAEWAAGLDSDDDRLLHWQDPATLACPCGLARGVTRQLKQSLPNLNVELDTIHFCISEDEDAEGNANDWNEVHFEARMNCPLRRVFAIYAEQIGVPVGQLRFEHNDNNSPWRIVDGEDTPSTIDLNIWNAIWARRLPLPPTPGPATDSG